LKDSGLLGDFMKGEICGNETCVGLFGL